MECRRSLDLVEVEEYKLWDMRDRIPKAVEVAGEVVAADTRQPIPKSRARLTEPRTGRLRERVP